MNKLNIHFPTESENLKFVDIDKHLVINNTPQGDCFVLTKVEDNLYQFVCINEPCLSLSPCFMEYHAIEALDTNEHLMIYEYNTRTSK